MRVRVKLCGITRLEDALVAIEAGADALGFVFHPPSPRYIQPEDAAEIIARLPAFVATVGVFVDRPAEVVRQIARTARLGTAQLHGAESPEYCESLGLRYIKAFRLREESDLEQLAAYGPGKEFLLDSFSASAEGGTGQAFDWRWAKAAARYGRIVLAGGLTPENVAAAIRVARPAAVDLSSGVESAPGIKDHARVRAFLRAVRETESPPPDN